MNKHDLCFIANIFISNIIIVIMTAFIVVSIIITIIIIIIRIIINIIIIIIIIPLCTSPSRSVTAPLVLHKGCPCYHHFTCRVRCRVLLTTSMNRLCPFGDAAFVTLHRSIATCHEQQKSQRRVSAVLAWSRCQPSCCRPISDMPRGSTEPGVAQKTARIGAFDSERAFRGFEGVALKP